jgi:hypothetical protein
VRKFGLFPAYWSFIPEPHSALLILYGNGAFRERLYALALMTRAALKSAFAVKPQRVQTKPAWVCRLSG